MELRELMNECEVILEKARNDFTAAAHGACREHLDDLRILLNEQHRPECGLSAAERNVTL